MARTLPRRKRQLRSTPTRTYPWRTARVCVDQAKFDALFISLGCDTDAARCRFLGMPHNTFTRIYEGERRPSAEFIGHALTSFGPYGLGFDDLFYVEVDAADLKAVA